MSLLRSIPDKIFYGGSKLEVVYLRVYPYIPCVFWVDSDSLVQLITNGIQDGGYKLAVVKLCTYVRWRVDFTMDSDCPRSGTDPLQLLVHASITSAGSMAIFKKQLKTFYFEQHMIHTYC